MAPAGDVLAKGTNTIMPKQNMFDPDVDAMNIGLATLRIGGSREASNNKDPFKTVIRRHHRARDITDEFSQAVKGKAIRASQKAMQLSVKTATA